jgi:hypothetical protein
MTTKDSVAAPISSASRPEPRLLYRFRPLCRLLDSGELDRQEIYFASPSELNDPMEGFRDLYWSGDRIVWENLFRHYLRCLNWALNLYRLGGEEHPLAWENIPVGGPHPGEAGSPQLEEMVDGMCADFLGEPTVSRLIDSLDGRRTPTRRDELRGYMRSLHPLGLGVVFRRHEMHKLCPPDSGAREMLARAKETLPNLDLMIQTLRGISDDRSEDLLREMFALFGDVSSQVGLATLVSHGEGNYAPNKDFLVRAFGEEFVDQLERLVYPNWRVACFLSDCRDSSLWGSYGDSHAGVCLVFKPDERDGEMQLPLTQITGFDSRGPTRGKVAQQFHAVRYSNKFAPVDFFRSIGNLPVGVLYERWHSNVAGDRSVCASDYGDQWRDEYWRGFYPGATTKLADWEREREHRLLLTDSLAGFSDVDSRKATYDFSNLHGLIFGIKTPTSKRLEICRIIERKCAASGRTDFRFYEAFYSERRGSIDHRELNLLRMKFPST